MSNSAETNEYLDLGISAARAGKKQSARQFFKIVLDRSPDNILALFWMAYVAAEPQQSIGYLERILALKPDNKQARAGIRWARQRLAALEAAAETDAAETETDSSLAVDRQQLLSKPEIQEQAQKGILAQRARRNINPFLAVWLMLGLGALLVAAIWTFALMPADTLAALLPSSTAGAATHQVRPVSQVEGRALPLTEPDRLNAASQVFTRSDTIALASLPEVPVDPLSRDPLFASFMSRSALSALATPVPLLPRLEAIDRTPDTFTPAAAAPSALVGPLTATLIGPELFVPVDESLLAHQPASPDEKWIEVDLSEQLVVAWEGNVPVISFLSSTGLPNTPTVLGEYHIYWKLESTLMAGPGYYLPDVPYTMYFYQGYALHGAYWHDNFGQPMSHGCVNLSPDNSKELFEWADPVIPEGQTQVVSSAENPGTLVVVHE